MVNYLLMKKNGKEDVDCIQIMAANNAGAESLDEFVSEYIPVK